MGARDHLQIEVSQEEDRVVLALDGELDMASAHLLERAVDDPEIATKPTVVLDLQHLEFIDSTGLRIILSARKRCRKRRSGSERTSSRARAYAMRASSERPRRRRKSARVACR